jgi:hypothetical protein
LVKDVTQEMVVEVWYVQATGMSGIGHYVVLLNDGTHLCTCLLLINKGLICRHFFRIATYSQTATFHITLISPHWYLEPNNKQETLIQQMSAITLCSNSEENIPNPNGTFKHLFSIRSTICNPYSTTIKPNKVIYAELFGLSKKVIDSAIKADMYRELSDMYKKFLYDVQKKIDENQNTTNDHVIDITGINNPNITKHKGRPPKRLKSSVEQSTSKGKRILRNNAHTTTDNKENADNNGDIKGRKCGNCKQYGHNTRTCQASIL